MRKFAELNFDDYDLCVLVLGINRGRFEAGVTGVTFMGPVALIDSCADPPRMELTLASRLAGLGAILANGMVVWCIRQKPVDQIMMAVGD